MKWWLSKPKCKTCDKVYDKDDKPAVIRLETAEGIHEIEVCNECADFWDKSADVLQRNSNDRNQITDEL